MMRMARAALRPQIMDPALKSDDSQDQDGPRARVGASMRLERDPVCGMLVDERENQYTYRGIGYAFCSQQCRERFAAAPRLYVGRRGLLAPKQQGITLIKRTRIALGAAVSETQFGALKLELLSMMGVIDVHAISVAHGSQPDQHIQAAVVSYDLLQATALQLERRVVEMNAALSNEWGERLRRDFVHYVEQCELADMALHNADPDPWKKFDRRSESGFRSDASARIARIRRGRRG